MIANVVARGNLKVLIVDCGSVTKGKEIKVMQKSKILFNKQKILNAIEINLKTFHSTKRL